MTKITPVIVYLDQNQWITLAQAQFAKHKVSVPAERDAADFIMKAARAGQICLPLSGGHMVETIKIGDNLRQQHLAETMLAVYDGWHMNNPVTVRGEELARALTQRSLSLDRDQVFNQRPGTPFGHLMPPYVCDDQTLPPQAQRFVEEQSWRLTWADILRTENYTASEWAPIVATIQAWAQTHQDLSTYLREHPAKRDMRVVAATKTLDDLMQELNAITLQIGLSVDELKQRVQPDTLVEFFQRLPFVGRVMEVTHLRLCNPQDAWVEHDLIDLLFLPCAAAYADYIVAERKTAHLLRRAIPLTSPGADICTNLRELRGVLDS